MLKILHCLDNRLTDGGKVVNVASRPPFTPRKINATHFCYRLSRLQGHIAAGRIKKTPWSETASELFRPSESRMSAKLVPTFAVRGGTWSA
jgi:hypothetical protein